MNWFISFATAVHLGLEASSGNVVGCSGVASGDRALPGSLGVYLGRVDVHRFHQTPRRPTGRSGGKVKIRPIACWLVTVFGL